LTAAGRIVSELADLDAVTSLTATATRIKSVAANLNAVATVSVDVIKAKTAQALLSSTSTVSASGRAVKRIVGQTLSSNFAVSANVSVKTQYWISEYIDVGGVIAVEADTDAVYTLFSTALDPESPGFRDCILVKRSLNGQVVWEKILDYTPNISGVNSQLKSDGLGNVYLLLSQYETVTQTFTDVNLIKLNSNGAVSWQSGLKILSGTNTQDTVNSINLDSSGNIYITGLTIGSTPGGYIVKYNSSGVQQWKKELSNLYDIGDIKVDSEGNIYGIAGSNRSDDTQTQFIFKMNSSASSIIWQKVLNYDSGVFASTTGGKIFLDSENNVIASFGLYNSSPAIAKFDSNGTLLQQNSLSGFVQAIDSADNMYLISGLSTFVKVDKNLNVLFQHEIVSSANISPSKTYNIQRLDLDANGVLHVIGLTSNSGITARLPEDGSRVDESYGPNGAANLFYYKPATGFSLGSANYTFDTASLTLVNSDLGIATSFPTISDAELTSTLTPLNLIRFQSAVSVTAQLQINAGKLTAYASNAQARFTQTVQGNVTRVTGSAVSVSAQLSGSAVRIKQLNSTVSTVSALTVTAFKVIQQNAELSAETALSAQPKVTRTFESEMSCAVEQNIAYTRIRDAVISTEALATSLTEAAKIGDFLIAFDNITNLTAIAVKTADQPQALTAVTSLSAQGQNLVSADADLTVSITVTAQIDKLKDSTVSMSLSAEQTADAVKTVSAESSQTVNTELACDSTRVRFADSSQSANFAQTTQGVRVKLFAVSMVSEVYNFTASPFYLFDATVNMTALHSTLTAGRVLHIDPYFTYLVEPESRLFKINKESREISIDPETRVNIIQGYPL